MLTSLLTCSVSSHDTSSSQFMEEVWSRASLSPPPSSLLLHLPPPPPLLLLLASPSVTTFNISVFDLRPAGKY